MWSLYLSLCITLNVANTSEVAFLALVRAFFPLCISCIIVYLRYIFFLVWSTPGPGLCFKSMKEVGTWNQPGRNSGLNAVSEVLFFTGCGRSFHYRLTAVGKSRLLMLGWLTTGTCTIRLKLTELLISGARVRRIMLRLSGKMASARVSVSIVSDIFDRHCRSPNLPWVYLPLTFNFEFLSRKMYRLVEVGLRSKILLQRHLFMIRLFGLNHDLYHKQISWFLWI